MDKKTEVLGYNYDTDRLELSQGQWYLVYSKLKGDELEGLKVRF